MHWRPQHCYNIYGRDSGNLWFIIGFHFRKRCLAHPGWQVRAADGWRDGELHKVRYSQSTMKGTDSKDRSTLLLRGVQISAFITAWTARGLGLVVIPAWDRKFVSFEFDFDCRWKQFLNRSILLYRHRQTSVTLDELPAQPVAEKLLAKECARKTLLKTHFHYTNSQSVHDSCHWYMSVSLYPVSRRSMPIQW